MTQGYRAAIVGCGKISRPHAAAFAATPGVDLVAAADLSERACRTLGEEFGVDRLYDDAGRMIAEERPDLVAICTWPGTHADLTEMACEAGVRAVICEKPIAVDLADADRMLEAARRSGAELVVNHQRRFGWSYAEARRLLDAGTIGRATQITGMCDSDALTSGTHVIDLIRFFAHDRPVVAVFGAIDMSPRADFCCFAPEFAERGTWYGHHIETSALATMVFDDGTRGFLETGPIARPGYARIVIEGTDGRIEVGGDPGSDDGPPLRYLRAGEDWTVPEPSGPPGDDMKLSLAALLRTLETGEEHLLDGSSGRAALEVVTALYESARRRLLVKLPLDCPRSPLEEMVAAGELPTNVPEVLRRFQLLREGTPANGEVEEVARLIAEQFPPLPGSWVDFNDLDPDELRGWYGETLAPPQYEVLARVRELRG
jgi:UDP-N-acetyl-2-amino-2-deoxyglucuronate dehydrogenase